MPRPRCPESIEAEKMYHEGERLVDIARSLGVPDGTVRRWKSSQDWDGKRGDSKKKESERSDKAKASVRKRGAQPGNKNSKGGPQGNIKAATHGAYMKIYGDLLTDEEKAIVPVLIELDERERLRNLYAQHQVSERRLMEHINAITNGAEMITHRTISHIEPTGQKAADGREVTKVVKISQEQETRKEQLRNFMDALTRVRAEMRRVADSLRQLDESEAKIKALNEGDDDIASLVDAINSAWEGAAEDADD